MKEPADTPALVASVTNLLFPQPLKDVRLNISVDQNFALVAEELFSKAMESALWDYRDNYNVVFAIISELKNTAMESVATEAGVARLADIAFGNDVARELIFSIQAKFIVQLAEFHNHWTKLIGHVAMCLTHTPTTSGADPGLSLVPEELVSRTYDVGKMSGLMLSNTWLIIIIFIILWGRVYSYDELRARQRSVTQA